MNLNFGSIQHIVNLTPHAVTICLMENNAITLPSEGEARVEEDNPCIHYLPDGLVVRQLSYGDIVGLPEPKPKTIYLVSRIVLQAAFISQQERRDLVAPGKLLRDKEGKIVAMEDLVVLTGLLHTGPNNELVR